jgi:hypothetical protein
VGLTPFLCFNGRLRWIVWLQRFPCVCFITQYRVQIILLVCGGQVCFRLLVTVLHFRLVRVVDGPNGGESSPERATERVVRVSN